MKKTIISGAFCAIVALMVLPGTRCVAQLAADAQPAPQAAAAPDDIRVNLMVKGVLVALSQANSTGNYSVLRDLGTPNFQLANNPARLAEVFAALRARKLDLTPVIFFNPKFSTPPALQDGQVLRVTGVFPTAPEQVNFDLAFQLLGDRWMIAGIAVNTSQHTDESPQASAATPSSLAQATAEMSQPASGRPPEAKPIRIDLSKPATPVSVPKKPLPPKKPKPATAAPPPPPQSTNQTPAQEQQPAQKSAQGETTEEKPAAPADKPVGGWNPFAR